jgi:hypothetical protein
MRLSLGRLRATWVHSPASLLSGTWLVAALLLALTPCCDTFAAPAASSDAASHEPAAPPGDDHGRPCYTWLDADDSLGIPPASGPASFDGPVFAFPAGIPADAWNPDRTADNRSLYRPPPRSSLPLYLRYARLLI